MHCARAVFLLPVNASLAKNVVRMRCAKNRVSCFQRCNWFRSENAHDNRIRRRSGGGRVMVIARWLFFTSRRNRNYDLASLLNGSYSVDNLASWGSSTNAASWFIFLHSTSEDPASRRKIAQKRSVIWTCLLSVRFMPPGPKRNYKGVKRRFLGFL